MYNKSIIVGRLTKDPELKQTPNGVSVTSFTLAVNRSYTPKGGERQADFLDCIAWRGTAEFICRYFSKGSAALIEGEIQTRSYVDKQGQNRKSWEVVASSAHFVESKGGGQPSADVSPPAQGAAEDFTELSDDSDLPFSGRP